MDQDNDDAQAFTNPHPQAASTISAMMKKYSNIALPANDTASVNKILFTNVAANLETLTLIDRLATTVKEISRNICNN